MGYTGEAVKSGCFEGAVDEEGIVICRWCSQALLNDCSIEEGTVAAYGRRMRKI